jgi:UDP-N-acetylmuramoylalanine--D-glutamate ligase
MLLKDSKAAVIGAARSGVAAAKLVRKLGGIPFVSDFEKSIKLLESEKLLKENKIEYELGNHSEKVFNVDLMIVSPGVPSDSKVIKRALEKGIKVISEVELAFQNCKGKIVAITGTNGKTTTTSLCGHIFKTAGVKTYVAGNIGYAFSEVALNANEGDYVVLEISSFQLDFIEKFKPNVAVILNITPDHLNRYENKFENYIKSKLRIYSNQDDKDFLVLNKDDEVLMKSLTAHNSKSFYFSNKEKLLDGCYVSDNHILFNEHGKLEFSFPLNELPIKGEHNAANAMAAVNAAKICDLDNEKIKEGLRTFKGVEHRLEFVRELKGVKYINDSKATNVDSLWYALRSFDEPIYLILGGQDKGNDYNKVKQLVIDKVKKIYAIGSSSDTVYNFFHSFVKVELKPTLEDVVISASNEARENEIVLLSPACASFDMFDNYEHRGKVFKEAVNSL